MQASARLKLSSDDAACVWVDFTSMMLCRCYRDVGSSLSLVVSAAQVSLLIISLLLEPSM